MLKLTRNKYLLQENKKCDTLVLVASKQRLSFFCSVVNYTMSSAEAWQE